MCSSYHLTRDPSKMISGLSYYFKNVKRDIIWEMQRQGSTEVERDMRNYFESLYIKNSDSE
jgi:hypothetical protein